jgi:hypothetical protein
MKFSSIFFRVISRLSWLPSYFPIYACVKASNIPTWNGRMSDTLTVAPTKQPNQFRAADGRIVAPPEGWEFLPAGDPGATRRVKAAGPVWIVVEKRGRKTFTRGVWADAAVIATVRSELEQERADPAYAKRLAAAAQRRGVKQAEYVGEFRTEVLEFLVFVQPFAALAERVADAVTAHATPVGSGTVARAKRIAVERRAEAAVLAWMRHQTTGYDTMKIARVKGRRREVRQELAEASRRLLDRHRVAEAHAAETCSLCRTEFKSEATS